MSTYPYAYDDLLYRLHLAKSTDDNYKKINLPPIKVTRKNRVSIIGNFSTFSERLNRPIEQISEFFKQETMCPNSINGQGQLIIQGALNEIKCESIMRNFIREFVMCKQCKGLDTHMLKENSLTFLECHQCLAKTSMGKI